MMLSRFGNLPFWGDVNWTSTTAWNEWEMSEFVRCLKEPFSRDRIAADELSLRESWMDGKGCWAWGKKEFSCAAGCPKALQGQDVRC